MNKKGKISVNLEKFEDETLQTAWKCKVFGVWICQTKLKDFSEKGLDFSHIYTIPI